MNFTYMVVLSEEFCKVTGEHCVELGGNGGFIGGVVENSALEDDPMVKHMVDAFRFLASISMRN